MTRYDPNCRFCSGYGVMDCDACSGSGQYLDSEGEMVECEACGHDGLARGQICCVGDCEIEDDDD